MEGAAAVGIVNPYSTELLVAHASKLSERVQRLISNDRAFVTRTNRDRLTFAYWTILFEHHNGILALIRAGNPTSAFAMLRVFEESFLKLFLVMFGTEDQLVAIRKGQYSTDFVAVGAQIDAMLEGQMFGKLYQDRIKTLHGLTHSGPEQVARQLAKQADGTFDIAPNYRDTELRVFVQGTMAVIFMAGAFLTEFLEFHEEHKEVMRMFQDYVETLRTSAELDEMIASMPQLY